MTVNKWLAIQSGDFYDPNTWGAPYPGDGETKIPGVADIVTIGAYSISMDGATVATLTATAGANLTGGFTATDDVSLTDATVDGSMITAGGLDATDLANANISLTSAAEAILDGMTSNVTMNGGTDVNIGDTIESSSISAGSVEFDGTMTSTALTYDNNKSATDDVVLNGPVTGSEVSGFAAVSFQGVTGGDTFSATVGIAVNGPSSDSGSSLSAPTVTFAAQETLDGTTFNAVQTVNATSTLTIEGGTAVTAGYFTSSGSLYLASGASISTTGYANISGTGTLEGNVTGATAGLDGVILLDGTVKSTSGNISVNDVLQIRGGGMLQAAGNVVISEAGGQGAITSSIGQIVAGGTFSVLNATFDLLSGSVTAASLDIEGNVTTSYATLSSGSITTISGNGYIATSLVQISNGSLLLVGGNLGFGQAAPFGLGPDFIFGAVGVKGNVSLGAGADVGIGTGGDLQDGNGTVFVGTSGTIVAQLNIGGDNSVLAAQSMDIGAGGFGTFEADAGGTVTLTNLLTIGDTSFGALVMNNPLSIAGGTESISDASFVIGATLSGSGQALVSGSGASWTTTGAGIVGNAGNGILQIGAGATIAVGGELSIAAQSKSVSGVTVTDAGTSLTAAGLAVGGTATQAGGTGNLKIQSGASVSVSGAAQVWDAGVTLVAGQLTAQSLVLASAGLVGGAGTLSIGGAISDAGSILATGGMLSVVATQVSGSGTLAIGGGATLALNAAIAAGVDVTFTGTTGTLTLVSPLTMDGTIANFGTGDVIDLAGVVATGAKIVGDDIEVSNIASPVVTFAATGTPDDNNDLLATPDGNGGTFITYGTISGTPSPPNVPLVTTVPSNVTATAGVVTAISGISISDPNADATTDVSITFTDSSGILAASAPDGGLVSTGAGGESLTISGVLAQVNADVATVTYTGAAAGSDVIVVNASDNIGDSDSHMIAVAIEPPCFCAGARIMTVRGAIAVERLAVGDLVVTAAGLEKPVVWLGQRRIMTARHRDPVRVWPVRVRAGAFASGRPLCDLWLSPDHAVHVDGVLIPIKHLVNGHTIAQVATDQVEYLHVELASHDILLAEGLPCESYLDTGNRSAFANGGVSIDLHPDFAARSWADACAELVQDGPNLVAVKQRLFRRAGLNSVRPELRLRIFAEQRELVPAIPASGVWRVAVPPAARALHLVSPAWIPAEHDAASLDRRALGVRLFGVAVDGVAIALDGPAPISGFHPMERTAEGDCRWTTGDARLVLPVGARVVTLHVGEEIIPEQAQRPRRDRSNTKY